MAPGNAASAAEDSGHRWLDDQRLAGGEILPSGGSAGLPDWGGSTVGVAPAGRGMTMPVPPRLAASPLRGSET